MKEFVISEVKAETAVLVGLITQQQNEAKTKEYLDELEFLADTAGAVTVKRFTQRLNAPSMVTYVGKGKLEEIKQYILAEEEAEREVGMVIFDDELSAKQMRNIEKELNVKILDRTSLILDIFAMRAQTANAKTQVELAQYRYMLPRLQRLWTHLERQGGGSGSGGGKGSVGLRGPGETQLEMDRRIILSRMALLKERLAEIDKQKTTQRKNRGRMVRMALRPVVRSEVEELVLEEVPDVGYGDIGGLGEQIELIRDAVELPFLHPDLYREHRLTPPRGVLLYGPPGCGKTLIAKAVAASLSTGGRGEAYFLNIKGPQLLDKYVGETERRIRVIFARAREKAATGVPVVVFFDEMDSLFRTRGSGRSSDVETTVVPQMLAEIDGVDELDNVVVIGATNREDMIDPAILRPGRLDVKIRIGRPDRRGAAEILATYLAPDLPISEELLAAHGDAQGAVDALIEQVIDALYTRRRATEMVELTRADGQVEILHVADLVSGAMLANIVDRAKKAAVKDLVTNGRRGLTSEHLRRAVIEEIMENEGLPATVHPDDWARVSGRRGAPVTSMTVLQRLREE